MATQTINVYADRTARLDMHHPDTNYSSAEIEETESYVDSLLIGFDFDSVLNTIKHKDTTKMTYKFYAYTVAGKKQYGSDTPEVVQPEYRFYELFESWDEHTVDYNHRPRYFYEWWFNTLYGNAQSYTTPKWNYTDGRLSASWLDEFITCGFYLESAKSGNASKPKFYTSRSALYKPYLEITYDDADVYTYLDYISPASGAYKDRADYIHLTTSVLSKGTAYEPPTIASSTFEVKQGGVTTQYDGQGLVSYTLPPNTITASSFSWRYIYTDSYGVTNTSAWQYIDTADATPVATTVYPKNNLIQDTEAIFRWQHTISSGTAQTKAELQWSSDGTTWNALSTVNSSAQETVIQTSTFSTSGQYYWRVRTFNLDNVASAWSDATIFSVLYAPTVTTVSAENSPHPLVAWQASGQYGYQVKIEGIYDSGMLYGSVYQHQIPKYLEDGEYVVSVRMQNAYGQTSDWKSVGITVANVSGTAISLRVYANSNDISLTWETSGYDGIIIYRDGVAIKRTTSNQFTDELVCGTHIYYVRGVYNNSGNYGLSNMASAELFVEGARITDIDSMIWLQMPTTDSSYSSIAISNQQESSSYHITGSQYPVIEVSSYVDKIYRLTASFFEKSLAFEDLLGKTVCYKKGYECVIGKLTNISTDIYPMYIKYDFQISQMDLNEGISE